jgi:hypothetical protein
MSEPGPNIFRNSLTNSQEFTITYELVPGRGSGGRRLENILFVQPGFDAADPVEGKFTIRGSSQIQTTFMVDGMPTFDEKLNEPYMNINQSAIQEIQIVHRRGAVAHFLRTFHGLLVSEG